MPDLLFQQLSTDLANLQKASQSVIEANNAYQTALKQFYADSNAIPQSPIIVTQ